MQIIFWGIILNNFAGQSGTKKMRELVNIQPAKMF